MPKVKRRVLGPVLVGVVAAFALLALAPTAALAKGASAATIDGGGPGGPGNGPNGPITLRGDGEPGSGTDLGTLADLSGLFPAMFGQSPDPMLDASPPPAASPWSCAAGRVRPPPAERAVPQASTAASGGLAEQSLGPGDLVADEVEAALEVGLPVQVQAARQLLLHLGLAAAKPRQARLHVAEQAQGPAHASLPEPAQDRAAERGAPDAHHRVGGARGGRQQRGRALLMDQMGQRHHPAGHGLDGDVLLGEAAGDHVLVEPLAQVHEDHQGGGGDALAVEMEALVVEAVAHLGDRLVHPCDETRLRVAVVAHNRGHIAGDSVHLAPRIPSRLAGWGESSLARFPGGGPSGQTGGGFTLDARFGRRSGARSVALTWHRNAWRCTWESEPRGAASTASPARPARTCSSTPTTRLTGTRGVPRRWSAPGPRTSRSCCRWGTRPVTGAT